MPGRNFLEVSRIVAAGPSEYFWRAAVVDAYYALFLECRDALLSWGRKPAKGQNVHAWTRLTLTYSSSMDLKRIADTLERLVRLRNTASYDLTATSFSPPIAQNVIQLAQRELDLLDQIQADRQRRAAAIASLPP